MTLQQLEYGLALLQHGSYSRAAKSVGISQPAMSIQIRKLEEEIGLMLFDRSQKKVQATYEGRIFFERAQVLLTQAKQLRRLAVELSEELSGVLNIGIIPTLAPYLLPLFIGQLNENFPKLKISVVEALTEDIILGLRAGELDGGIISTPIESKLSFKTIPLFYEGFKLFVSTNHPLYKKNKVALKDIPPYDIWLLKEGNCFRDQVDNMCEIPKGQHAKDLFFFESNSIEALCRIVEFKGGVTFLPELTTIQFNADREDLIKELAGPRRVREISLIHLPNQTRKQALGQLTNIIRDNIPKNMLSKDGSKAIPTKVRV